MVQHGNAEKRLPSAFLEGNWFLSLRMDAQSQRRTTPRMFLQQRARELQSRVLSVMAFRVEADPFRKVKNDQRSHY